MVGNHRDNRQIILANFSLHPMSDNFVEIIENALQETDTSKVWMETDDVSTTVQGKLIHVFNVTMSICLHAAKTGKHVAFQATYTTACPGNIKSNSSKLLEVDDIPRNKISGEASNLYTAAKFAIYPLGDGDYIDFISKQIELMKQFVTVTPSYSTTKLSGSLIDVFKGLENVFHAMYKEPSHTVMTVNMSLNSPSHEN